MTATDPLILRPRRSIMGRHRLAGAANLWVGSTIITFVFVVAIFAPLLAPYSPYDQDLSLRLTPPVFLQGGTWAHPLGMDNLGRDYLSRLVYGARVSLFIGLGTVAISGLFGTSLGLLAGYFRGWVDQVAMFLVTVRLSMPLILVALAVVGLLGSSLVIIVAVLSSLLWDRFAVVARAATMQLREQDFVLAARAVGCSPLWIISREILPHLTGSIVVIATLEMANAILLEAGLSFLGLGVRPPAASWGLMIAEAKDLVFFESWLINIPGISLFVLVMAINLLGDGLRDRFAPSQRK
jgi:peptide/nickel transport system permease protein